MRESGFAVATHSEHCLVLLPTPSLSWMRCLAPGQSHTPSQDPAAGRGVTVEFVPRGADGGRLLVCVVAARVGKGKAFLDEFRCRLKVAAHRAKLGSSGCESVHEEPAESGFLRDSVVYYHVSRLLCSPRTAVGATAADFVQGFRARYSIAPRGPPPTTVSGRTVPMAECLDAVNQLCQAVQDSWGDAATTEAVGPAPRAPTEPRLRACVERHLFARVGPALWQIYSGLSAAEDARYEGRAAALRELGDAELLRMLEVRESLRGVATVLPLVKGGLTAEDVVTEATRSTAAGSDEDEADVAGAEGNCADGGSLGHGALEGEAADATVSRSVYQRAAAALSRVQDMLVAGHSGAPHEAMEALSLAQLEMRTCALEASGGQEELGATEDALPVFLFALLRSRLARPLACARLLSDALSSEEKLNSEGKAVRLLESAARRVAEGRYGHQSDHL